MDRASQIRAVSFWIGWFSNFFTRVFGGVKSSRRVAPAVHLLVVVVEADSPWFVERLSLSEIHENEKTLNHLQISFIAIGSNKCNSWPLAIGI